MLNWGSFYPVLWGHVGVDASLLPLGQLFSCYIFCAVDASILRSGVTWVWMLRSSQLVENQHTCILHCGCLHPVLLMGQVGEDAVLLPPGTNHVPHFLLHRLPVGAE